uniref:BCAS3 domain-containing protein n=1 Tax=Leersia perrieri TaxID=77586 RepID=A0A0D9WD93_9ORYZ
MGQAEEASVDEEEEVKLLSVSWNQDNSCFIAATTNGFRVFQCKPFQESMRRMFGQNGGIGIAAMLFRTSIFGIVGAESNTEFPPTMLKIWDDYNECRVDEYNFMSKIRSIKLSKDYFVVVLEKTINVYRFKDLKLFYQARTVSNLNGLCCLSHHVNASVFACPGTSKGQVLVEHFGLKETILIAAHASHLSCMTMTLDGTLLATASVKGTLIRIFNTRDGTCVQEVRRGLDRAEIYSIALSQNVQWLAVSSDKGTVHVFSLRVKNAEDDANTTESSTAGAPANNNYNCGSMVPVTQTNTGSNTSSSLSFMKGILPKYFSSEWSFAQFRLPEVTRHITAFGDQDTVMMIGLDGSFYRYSFDPVNGGEMMLKEYHRFLKTSKPL